VRTQLDLPGKIEMVVRSILARTRSKRGAAGAHVYKLPEDCSIDEFVRASALAVVARLLAGTVNIDALLAAERSEDTDSEPNNMVALPVERLLCAASELKSRRVQTLIAAKADSFYGLQRDAFSGVVFGTGTTQSASVPVLQPHYQWHSVWLSKVDHLLAAQPHPEAAPIPIAPVYESQEVSLVLCVLVVALNAVKSLRHVGDFTILWPSFGDLQVHVFRSS